jgi:endoglycosylceramidase
MWQIAVFSVSSATHARVQTRERDLLFGQRRGLNVVYKGAPWHPITDSDGFDPFLSMNVVDAAVWQSLGLNVVRLGKISSVWLHLDAATAVTVCCCAGMMWPGVVPSAGVVNTSYLQIMHNLTDMLGSYGIYSLLDFHQDSVADLFCGEGIPTWAATKYSSTAEPFPVPVDTAYVLNSSTGLPNLQDCTKHGWTDYYFADAACKATQALYSNINGAADDFMFFWQSVASYWSAASWIIGYELMNEPWAGKAPFCHMVVNT